MRRRVLVGLWPLAVVSCAQEYDVTQRVDVDPDEVTECDFEAIDDARGFSRYTCNPVFETTGEAWSERLISTTFLEAPVAEHAFYQIWYAGLSEGGDGGDTEVGTAISADGTEWTVHEDNPGWFDRSSSDWDGAGLQRLKVAWDDERLQYRMLYGGYSSTPTFGLGTAASLDGVSWTADPLNPVLSLSGRVGGINYSWAVTYDIEDGRHRALLAGSDDGEADDLWLVEADDPSEWVSSDARRVLRAGASGRFDDEGFVDAAEVRTGDERWLFYVGYADRIEFDDGTFSTSDMKVGVARWEDDEWVRLQDEAFPLHNTERGVVRSIAARPVGSRIHVWITDRYPELDDDDTEVSAVGYFVFDPEAW